MARQEGGTMINGVDSQGQIPQVYPLGGEIAAGLTSNGVDEVRYGVKLLTTEWMQGLRQEASLQLEKGETHHITSNLSLAFLRGGIFGDVPGRYHGSIGFLTKKGGFLYRHTRFSALNSFDVDIEESTPYTDRFEQPKVKVRTEFGQNSEEQRVIELGMTWSGPLIAYDKQHGLSEAPARREHYSFAKASPLLRGFLLSEYVDERNSVDTTQLKEKRVNTYNSLRFQLRREPEIEIYQLFKKSRENNEITFHKRFAYNGEDNHYYPQQIKAVSPELTGDFQSFADREAELTDETHSSITRLGSETFMELFKGVLAFIPKLTIRNRKPTD